MRTVAFETGVIPSPCCEVPHAEIHVPDAALGRPGATTTDATTSALIATGPMKSLCFVITLFLVPPKCTPSRAAYAGKRRLWDHRGSVTHHMSQSIRIGAAALLIAAATLSPRVQAQSAGAVDLSGTWTLDTYVSDSPEQVAAAVRLDLGLGPVNRSPDDSTNGRGGRSEGRGRGGMYGRQGAPPRQDITPEDQARIDEVINTVRYAAATVTVAQNGSSVTFTDARGVARTYQTSGKKEKQTFGSATVDTTARWQGPQLVIETDLPRDRRMTTTWSIAPTTKQLLMRVSLGRGTLEMGPFQVKQVYNRSTS